MAKNLLQCESIVFMTVADTLGRLYSIYCHIPPPCSAFLPQQEPHFYSGMLPPWHGHMAGGESWLVSANHVGPIQLANNWPKVVLGDRILAFEPWGQASWEDLGKVSPLFEKDKGRNGSFSASWLIFSHEGSQLEKNDKSKRNREVKPGPDPAAPRDTLYFLLSEESNFFIV